MNMFSERVQSRADARETTRRRVLEAAERLFREYGYAATTVRRIAAEAGVSAGTVVGVGEKDALLIAIVDEWIGAVHAARAAAPSDPGPISAAEAADRVVAVVAPFVGYFQADGDLSREYAAVLARGRHPSRVFGDLADALVGEFEAILCSARHPNPGAGARAVYYVYLGILFSASGGALDADAARDRLTEAVGQLIGTGEDR
jgi:AcrR family transcriptional regulator